jgi:large subunit ribosomal protein L6
MSRIGKKPISVPSGVSITIDGSDVRVKGKLGELHATFNPEIGVTQEDSQIMVSRPTDERRHRALHGLTRALLNNMVIGVSQGFEKHLEIEGVGYRAEVKGKDLILYVGYSHEVRVVPPEGISFEVPGDSKGRTIVIRGVDKQAVGQIAADIRKIRPPEPYKGKGIRYRGEYIRMKAGKAGKGK